MIHEKIHDGFWHHVGEVFAHNIKVGSDQGLDDFHFNLLLLCHRNISLIHAIGYLWQVNHAGRLKRTASVATLGC